VFRISFSIRQRAGHAPPVSPESVRSSYEDDLGRFLYTDMNVSVDRVSDWFFDGTGFQFPASSSDGGRLFAIAAEFSSTANGVWLFESRT